MIEENVEFFAVGCFVFVVPAESLLPNNSTRFMKKRK
jgi:hypothetical protein